MRIWLRPNLRGSFATKFDEAVRELCLVATWLPGYLGTGYESLMWIFEEIPRTFHTSKVNLTSIMTTSQVGRHQEHSKHVQSKHHRTERFLHEVTTAIPPDHHQEKENKTRDTHEETRIHKSDPNRTNRRPYQSNENAESLSAEHSCARQHSDKTTRWY
jgi:hypothetical protein